MTDEVERPKRRRKSDTGSRIVYWLKRTLLPDELRWDVSETRTQQYADVAVPTVSALTGTDGDKQVLVRCTSQGALRVGHAHPVMLKVVTTSVVPAGRDERIMVTPPEGYVARISQLAVDVLPPAGATSGSHKLEVTTSPSIALGVAAVWGHNTRMLVTFGMPQNAVLYEPTDIVAWDIALRDIWCSVEEPAVLSYINDTDADQANQRNYWLQMILHPDCGAGSWQSMWA
jgi:hypothetical protein